MQQSVQRASNHLSLPDETLLQIISYLDDDAASTFSSLSLACRRLHAIVTPMLYRQVSLTVGNAELLKRTLESKGTYSKYIKKLAFVWSPELLSRSVSESQVASSMVSAMSLCTSLEEIEFVGQFTRTLEVENPFRVFTAMPELRVLTCPADQEIVQLLPSMAHLQILHLDGSFTQNRYRYSVDNRQAIQRLGEKLPDVAQLYLNNHKRCFEARWWTHKLWKTFSQLTSFTVDFIYIQEMQLLMSDMQPSLIQVAVEVASTHYENLQVELAQVHSSNTSVTPPPLQLTLRSQYAGDPPSSNERCQEQLRQVGLWIKSLIDILQSVEIKLNLYSHIDNMVIKTTHGWGSEMPRERLMAELEDHAQEVLEKSREVLFGWITPQSGIRVEIVHQYDVDSVTVDGDEMGRYSLQF